MSASFPGSSKSMSSKSKSSLRSRTFLYRRLGSAVIVILFVTALSPRSVGQMPQLKRPQDTSEEKPAEDKKPKKKVKGPRALGLLQLNTSSNKGTLIPIAILVEGKFYDASIYKADPVPMALESGTVYEVEQTGSSQGLFTINGTLHSTEGNAHPWTGSGSYLPNGTSVAQSTRKAEDVPVGRDNIDGDAPPRLTRGKAAKPPEAAGPNPPPAAGAPAGAATEKP